MALKRKIGRPPLDITNKKFGRLAAIKLTQDRPKKRKWQCKCTCGNVCEADQGHLQEGTSNSCGCLKHEHIIKQIKNHTLPPGEAFTNAMYALCKRAAKNSKRIFLLTREEFVRESTKPCYYCNAEPRQPPWGLRSKKLKINWFNGIPKLNGLDRKDNSFGYTIDNVVPCCKTCNFAKGAMTVNEFIALAHKVVRRWPADPRTVKLDCLDMKGAMTRTLVNDLRNSAIDQHI